jgi:hypothetical protein
MRIAHEWARHLPFAGREQYIWNVSRHEQQSHRIPLIDVDGIVVFDV